MQEINSNNFIYGKRDIANFVRVRIAGPGDDQAIGHFVLSVFTSTYERKLPHIPTPASRNEELLDVPTRRRDGIVLVIELGFRIIGTVSIVHPEAKSTQAWKSQAANIRCLAIDPTYHGLQLSDILLDEAEKLAKAWGCHFVCLHVQDGADKVAQLYVNRGYHRDSQGDFSTHGNLVTAYYLDLFNKSGAGDIN